MQTLIIIGVALACGAFFYFLPRLSARSTLASKKARATLEALGCTREKGIAHGDFEGEHFELLAPFDQQPARLRLSVPGVGCRIRVTRNHGIARFWTGIGFSRPIESGDTGFDNDFYVESTDGDYAAALLRHRTVRSRIEQLMPVVRNDLRMGGEWLVVPLPRNVLHKPDGAARIRDVLRQSRLLAEEVRRVPPHSASATPRKWPLSLLLLLSGLGLGAVSSALWIRMMDRLLPEDVVAAMKLCGWISLAGFIVLQAVVVVVCAGRSDAHRLLGMSFFGGALSVPLLVVGLAFGGNAVLDRSPPRRVEVDVRKLEFDEKAKKGGGQWDLFVSSWHADRKIDLVHPAKDEAAALEGSSRVAIELRDGAFGWERILGIEPMPER